MDSTKNSSFVPLDYYKKLTNCLANRKQIKVNLNTIPGIKDYKKKPKKVMLTNEKIHAKFLAKYSENKESQTVQKQQMQSQEQQNQNINQNEGSVEKEKIKRKKDESFLNLSPTFFKAYKGPELSIFKVPEIPQSPAAKKPKISHSTETEFTIASLFSGNFNPRKTSTPNEKAAAVEQSAEKSKQLNHDKPSAFNNMLQNNENQLEIEQKQKPLLLPDQDEVVAMLELEFVKSGKSQTPKILKQPSSISLPKPFISDPNDILKGMESQLNFEKETVKAKSQQKLKNPKDFDDLVTRAANKLNNKCFSKIDNPIKSIQNRLLAIHDRAIQSPRPSMLSERISTPKTSIGESQPVFKIPNLPKPVFYENKEQEVYFSDIDETVNSLKKFNISETPALFDSPGINVNIFPKKKFNIDVTPVIFNSPAFSLSAFHHENNFIYQNDHMTFKNKSNFDETSTLFDQETKYRDFERYNYNLYDSTQRHNGFLPSTSKNDKQKDLLADSFFESPTNFFCDNDEMSWIDRSFESILNPKKHILQQQQQQFSPNAFSIFKSPPNSISSDLSLQQKFAKAINRLENDQTNIKNSTFFEDIHVNRNKNEWMKSYNGTKESLPQDNSTNYNLFDYKFF
ncbi:hypothetical protein PVAND_001911 [Polypedilum vanderplanki]|uniref:Uncharacterized protein n=1 Tax=Polypedilum vanderplanki TaxID=319348 RepID=A0A9J6BQM4_POLVA|nr:hypothetical protein PVAND_001911 [Polypedilum vanderplanki]